MKKLGILASDRIGRYSTRIICLILFLLTLSQQGKSNGIHGTVFDDFDKCNSQFHFRFMIYNYFSTGDDDRLSDGKLYYKNTNNEWIEFYQARDFSFAGSTFQSSQFGRDFYHKSSYPGYVLGEQITVAAEHNNSENAFLHVWLRARPADMKLPAEFKFGYAWLNWHDQSDATDVGEHFSNQKGIQAIDPVINLTASTTECNIVKLTWIAPSQNWTIGSSCPNPGTYSYDIYLNGNYIWNTSQTSLDVINLQRGVDYSLSVRTKWVPTLNPYGTIFSNTTNSNNGKLKDPPPVPPGFEASQARCDGSINLTWQWNDANPQQGFIIERSTNSNFFPSINIPIASDKRSHLDQNLTRGVTYYYRIRSKNECYVESSSSSPISGISPAVPPQATGIQLVADSILNVIKVSWNDNCSFEDRYSVERTALGEASASYDVDANKTLYIDDQIGSCINYNYVIKVYSTCAPNGVASTGLYQTRLTPNLTNTFDEIDNKLKCSKGYFPDRVELKWSCRNKPQLNSIRIYRKPAGSAVDSTLVGSVSSGTGIFIDNSALASVLYKYTLIGETQCAGVTRFSNFTEDVGFRSPTGILNGNVSYTGGFAVQGVKVLARSTSGAKGGSLIFNGVSSYASVPNSTTLNSPSQITIETWAKITERQSFALVSKYNPMQGGYRLFYDSSSNVLNFQIANNSGQKTLSITNPFIPFNTYYQVTAVLSSDSMLLYINGTYVSGIERGSISIGSNSENLFIGGVPGTSMFGAGNIDELRIYKAAKTAFEISRDFNRTVAFEDERLITYFTFDEKVNGLTRFFDQSNYNTIYNENHGTLYNNAAFSDSVPTASQLALATYTDESGNFTIANVRYSGSGQNFSIVPALDIHTFTPSNKVLYVGDGAQVHNNVDFIDNSSFEFVGMVKYAGTTCPAVGASVLIDGNIAILNNQQVLVNDSGKFVVRVPIGNHVVSLSKNKHVFSQGRFPPTGTYNFQSPVSAAFVDSTFIKVVGRVCGGSRELNKVAGLGRSKNNIGKAQFTFNSVGQSGISGCFSRSVVTNDSSGEYISYLLPLRYTINGLRLVNNFDPTLLTKSEFNNPNVLDLTTVPDLIVLTDKLETPTFSRIDTTVYHKRLDFKYFVKPDIYVSKTSTPFDSLLNNFIGETKIKAMDSIEIQVGNNQLGYPVFEQGKYYTAKVKVVEVYTNIDRLETEPGRTDRVPVSGTLKFYNDLSTLNDTLREAKVVDGVYTYGFRCGVPNILVNSVKPEYTYTKTFQIEFLPDVGITVNWEPNKEDPTSQLYRAYVLGSRSSGNAFTSAGPALVDYVLRDPPGSLSSATWTSGTSKTQVVSYSIGNTSGIETETKLLLGTKVETSVGVGAEVHTEFETDHSIGLGITSSLSITSSGELVTTTSNSKTISTSGDPSAVGRDADIYVGKTTNLIFGKSDVIRLLDTATCRFLQGSQNTQVCFGQPVNGFQLGRGNGFFLVPGDIKSTFVYTEKEIIDLIIPSLEAWRNRLLTDPGNNKRGQKRYVPVFNDPTDPKFRYKFGSNNDDPIWGALRSTPTHDIKEANDTIGQSYHFRGDSQFETDSIRYYNTQITLWKQAIAANEKKKYQAIRDTTGTSVPGGRNISIGQASYSQEFSSQTDESVTRSFEWNIGESLSLETGETFNKFGWEFAGAITFEQTFGIDSNQTNSVFNTFGYTLQDGDKGDLMSVDVIDPKDGTGHIFRLRAGRTSCPYEGQKTARFFDPNNDTITSSTYLTNGVEIQQATSQNDIPYINISQKSVFNVPAADEAVFTLEMGNGSEGGQERAYMLKVDPSTNPGGAIIKVDGLDPNREFDVPYGATLQKTLTVKRGPVDYDYIGLKMDFESLCDDKIADSVFFNVRFLPTCTDLSLKSPDDRWVLNTSFNDTLPILIGDYNYNFGGFESVHFQYRPASENTWYNERSFYKDTADVSMLIPIGSPGIFYPFSFKNLPDGKYELRANSECKAPGYPNTKINSLVMQGVVDRVNPHPFGTPSPGDGILSPNDDISIQFNEAIQQSTLSLSNFDIRGVLNKTNLRSSTSIYFDGDNDVLDIPPGLDLKRKSFTIEFWHRRATLGEQVLISQGADVDASFDIGFTTDNKFFFRIGAETVTSTLPILDTTLFAFYAVSYNSETQTADLIRNENVINIGNNRIYNPYEGAGKLLIGKSSVNAPKFLKGNMYELRIWSKTRNLQEINTTKSTLLSGTENGLIANWRMDEATGTLVRDYSRSRNATIYGANWYLSPSGNSYSFDGENDYITIPTTHFGLTKEMDFTVEFWFKGNQPKAGLLSNGKGLSTDVNNGLKWSIESNDSGIILIKHNGNTFEATNENYFDGNWHHFALIMRRTSNLSCYIDGNLQNSIRATNFDEWGAAKLWFGARGWNNNGSILYDSTDSYFSGQLDELRIWNTARLTEQIKRDKNNRLNGNETGLVLYVPFESYQEVMGFPILNPTNLDITSNSRTFSSFGDAGFSMESPTVKLPRPVQNINFTYAVNNDKIIITPTTANEFIENVTLDITVKNVNDEHGNKMQSPKTWIAYMDRNQVKWQDDELSFDIESGQTLSFSANIINSGGALKEFTIGNLPAWLKASPSASSIGPNSSKQINFTLDPTMNIGNYEQDLSLNTDFGFADKLLIKVRVRTSPPNWSVNPAAFQKSMSIIGQVKIGGVISANTEDKLAAFVNNQCRGVSNVVYYEQLDKYLVFMDIYGLSDGEPIEFRIWNASQGKTHADVQPALDFQTNGLVGAVQNPQIFNALDKVTQALPLQSGWNWVSFNLLMADSSNLINLFSKLNKPGAQIKNNTEMAVYDENAGWVGNLANFNTGIKPEKSYLLYSPENDTLQLKGIEANPQLRPIDLQQGWNYLGFVSQRNLKVADAFGSFNAKHDDLLKGQTSFAVYDSIIGWIGSLIAMKPNSGYLFKSGAAGTLTYPRSAMFGKKGVSTSELVSKHWHFEPYAFTSNMNIISSVPMCSANLESGNWLLGGFVNGKLRGFAKAQQVTKDSFAYFITVAGEGDEQVSFKLLNEVTGKEIDLNESITYRENSLNGAVRKPIILTPQQRIECLNSSVGTGVGISSSIYPVPVSDILNLELTIPQEERTLIKLYDISGKELATLSNELLSKGTHSLSFSLSGVQEGVYILKIETTNETLQHKLVKQ